MPVVHIVAVLGSGLYAGISAGGRLCAKFAGSARHPSGFVQLPQIHHLHFKPALFRRAVRARHR
jgi:hypothetical protein